MDKMKIKEKIGEKIDGLIEQGITSSNLDALDKLIDMMKDVHEIEKIEKEGGQAMYRESSYGARGNYRENGYSAGSGYGEGYSEGGYGEYSEGYQARGRGRSRDSQGRFRGGRGSGRYRGEEMLDEVYEAYQGYSEGREEYSRGNYGAQSTTMKSLEFMMQSVVEFIKMLEKEASSQEEVKLIKEYTKKISEM